MENVFSNAKWQKQRDYKVKREYKDSLFRFIFQDKKDLLDLYNAINGTEYSEQEDLVITTLEDVVYLGFKNDISFLIGYDLNLYEHQSTWNPNMPLRGFFYFADMYRGFIELNDIDIYSSGRIMLPTPKYIVFYNGEKEEPDELTIRLSDSFERKDSGQCALECAAVLLNINYGHNHEIMQKCRRLADYAYFVQAVKINIQKGIPIKAAIDNAAEECIKKDILADVLRKNRAEVKDMLLTVYNEKQHNRTLREEGRQEGYKLINDLYQRLMQDGRESDMKRAICDVDYREQLLKEYELDD